MGTGAYTLQQLQAGRRHHAEAESELLGPKPPIKTINFKFIPEDCDAAPRAPLGRRSTGRSSSRSPDARAGRASRTQPCSSRPGMNQDQFAFNIAVKPFDDIHVRRAFAYALDRTGLVKSLLRGHGEVAVGQGEPRAVGRQADRAAGPRVLPARSTATRSTLRRRRRSCRSPKYPKASPRRSSSPTASPRPGRSPRTSRPTWRRSASS